jgi:hypothetical protein
MRVRTVQDLNGKLQKFANATMDEAMDFEMRDIEYTESLRKRVSELNLEISMYRGKITRNGPLNHPDLNARMQPTWDDWPPDEYQVNFGTWKGERILATSHTCVQCKLVKIIMEKNEQDLGDLLLAEVEVSFILDVFTLKPQKVLLLLQTPDQGSSVWGDITLLCHLGEFCLTRHAISHKYELQTSPVHIPLESSCRFLLRTEDNLPQIRSYN